MTTDQAERITDRVRAIASPLRLTILGLLDAGDRSALELAARSSYPYKSIHGHLEPLRLVGLITRRRSVNGFAYAITDDGRKALSLALAFDPSGAPEVG